MFIEIGHQIMEMKYFAMIWMDDFLLVSVGGLLYDFDV